MSEKKTTTATEPFGSDIIAKLTEPFPETCLKEREGPGGKMLTYVPAVHYIKRLNDVLGADWEFHVTSTEIRKDYSKDMGVELFDSVTVNGTLSITIEDKIISRDDKGSKEWANNVALADLEIIACTNCLKRCCRQFGIGLYLYDEDEIAEINESRFNRNTAHITKPQFKQSSGGAVNENKTQCEYRDRSGDTRHISDKQIKRLYAISASAGWTLPDNQKKVDIALVESYIYAICGATKMDCVRVCDYDVVCAAIEAGPVNMRETLASKDVKKSLLAHMETANIPRDMMASVIKSAVGKTGDELTFFDVVTVRKALDKEMASHEVDDGHGPNRTQDDEAELPADELDDMEVPF